MEDPHAPSSSGQHNKHRPLSFSAPSHRPHRYYREPWSATLLDQAKLFASHLLCVAGSGALAKTAVAPLERIKLLLQVQPITNVPVTEQYSSLTDALRRIPEREGGWTALYRGNGANVLRLIPEVSLRFLLHDQFKLMFAPGNGNAATVSDRLAAGAATGIVRSLLFHPLDLCRVRITTDVTRAGLPRPYTTIRQCMAATVRKEGIRGLYKGLLTSMIGIVPYLSISLTTYDTLKDALPQDKKSRSQWWYPLLKMGSGSAAAVTAQALVYPLDTLRRRLQMNGAQTHKPAYQGMVDCVRTMVRHEGVLSLYRGLGVSCLRTVPGAAVQFVTYDLIKTGIAVLDPTAGVSSPL